MKNIFSIIFVTLLFVAAGSCSKKTNPSGNTGAGDKANTAKPVVVKKIKTPVPKIIVVNDSTATKTFDGKLYYDLEGHRYWKNYKDGKYYIYNKSMNTDPDFRKPQHL